MVYENYNVRPFFCFFTHEFSSFHLENMIKNVKLLQSDFRNWEKLSILKNGIPSLAGAVVWPKWDKTLCTACEIAFFLVFSNTTSDRYAHTCSIKINTRWKKSISVINDFI